MPAREFKWTKKRVLAAALLAEDELSDEKIAETVGTSRNAIAMWKRNPVFAARVHSILVAWERRVMNTGIANKARRVHALSHPHCLQMQIIEERSENAALKAQGETGKPLVPGCATGLVVVRERVLGLKDGKHVIGREAWFDHRLSREIRATLDQAAKETGQFVARHERSGGNGRPIAISIDLLDDIAERVRAGRSESLLIS